MSNVISLINETSDRSLSSTVNIDRANWSAYSLRSLISKRLSKKNILVLWTVISLDFISNYSNHCFRSALSSRLMNDGFEAQMSSKLNLITNEPPFTIRISELRPLALFFCRSCRSSVFSNVFFSWLLEFDSGICWENIDGMIAYVVANNWQPEHSRYFTRSMRLSVHRTLELV